MGSRMCSDEDELAGRQQEQAAHTYLESDSVEDHLAGHGGDVEVERGEAAQLHPEQQPEQKLLTRAPRRHHLHRGVPLRYGRVNVGHARTSAAGVAAADGVLREREEAGDRLVAVAAVGGVVVALLGVQQLQAVL